MQLTPIIAFHLCAASAATVLGPFVLWARIGHRLRPVLHRRVGRVWVGLMAATALSAIAIRDFRLPNIAGYTPIHLMVPTALLAMAAAVWAVRRGHAVLHRRLMLGVYLGGCIGAGAFALVPRRFLGGLLWGGSGAAALAWCTAVLSRTPGWVWLLLGVLVAAGLRQMRTQRVGLLRLTLWPAAMSVLSAFAVWAAFGAAPAALAAWAAGWALGCAALLRRPVPAAVRYDLAARCWQVPGSAVPLALMLAIFTTRYASNVALAIRPDLVHALAVQATIGGLYGVWSGCFAARALRLLPMAQAGAARPGGAARRAALALATLLAGPAAHAGMAAATLDGREGDGPVTVFFPSAGSDQPAVRGTFALQLDPGAVPVRGNGRLVVMSHGSGGSPWTQYDLARMLVQAGFLVAMPQHRGDHFADMSAPGPESWERRPAEVGRAIDAVARDARLGPLLALDRVGVYGMSAGGHAALSLAGGRWSPAAFDMHCQAHIAEDFPACVGLASQLHGNALDGAKIAIARQVIRYRFGGETAPIDGRDPRVAAVVAAVPFAADFEPASLAAIAIPVGLVTAAQDRWLAPAFHSDAVRRACTACVLLADLPAAGHGALLSPPPRDLAPAAAALLGDPPGFDRAVLVDVHARIATFFRQHLLP